jgi:hypothetical protein
MLSSERGAGEYAPIQQKEALFFWYKQTLKYAPKLNDTVISGSGTVTRVKNDNFNDYEVKITGANKSTVSIAKNYYYGYTLKTEGDITATDISVNKKTGQIDFEADGTGKVFVIYKNTMLTNVSMIVSFIGLVLLTVVTFKKRVKE